MKTFISMLRGINVSGQKPVRMAELANLYRSLGFHSVETYLQSGNVVFGAPEDDRPEMASSIEAQIEQTFGFPVAVFVREVESFQEIVDRSPFLGQRNEDPTKLHITFLYRSPGESKWGALEVPTGETAEFARASGAVYLFCPDGYGRTKLSNTFFERKLGVPATTRNWKTVLALLRMGKERLE